METKIELCDLDEAIENFMEKLQKSRLLEAYVYSNLLEYYSEVADCEEVNEFIATGRDTSVVLDLGEI
jgi:hypothetical protein